MVYADSNGPLVQWVIKEFHLVVFNNEKGGSLGAFSEIHVGYLNSCMEKVKFAKESKRLKCEKHPILEKCIISSKRLTNCDLGQVI